MGQTFGSTDGLDPQGNKLGQGASADQLGLTGGQLFARKAMQGGLQGISQGAGSMQPPKPASPMGPIQPPQQPMVGPSYFGQNKNNFYGQ